MLEGEEERVFDGEPVLYFCAIGSLAATGLVP